MGSSTRDPLMMGCIFWTRSELPHARNANPKRPENNLNCSVRQRLRYHSGNSFIPDAAQPFHRVVNIAVLIIGTITTC